MSAPRDAHGGCQTNTAPLPLPDAPWRGLPSVEDWDALVRVVLERREVVRVELRQEVRVVSAPSGVGPRSPAIHGSLVRRRLAFRGAAARAPASRPQTAAARGTAASDWTHAAVFASS